MSLLIYNPYPSRSHLPSYSESGTMELYMSSINFRFTKDQISTELSRLLHSEHFAHLSQNPINYHLRLHPDRRRGIYPHGGTGTLTLPSESIGNHLLALCGSAFCPRPFLLGGRPVKFALSKHPKGMPGIVDQITLRAFQPPHIVAERERRTQQLADGKVTVTAVQFGWECRDWLFSVECEVQCIPEGSVAFGEERREVRVQIPIGARTYYIAIHFSDIDMIYVGQHLDEYAIVFSLNSPPSYETNNDTGASNQVRKRLSFLPIDGHERVAPYTSLAIRLVCASAADMQDFHDLSEVAHLRRVSADEYPIIRRDLFSAGRFRQFKSFQEHLSFSVNYQVESILRSLVVDLMELLDLMPTICDIYRTKGEAFILDVLRRFTSDIHRLQDEGQSDYDGPDDVRGCFDDCVSVITKGKPIGPLKPTDPNLFEVYHVSITATTMYLEGPFPERSNRVIRSFDKEHHTSFLRVSFIDEGKSNYRFDQEVDGPDFLRRRVLPILLDGLRIANAHFYFLGYSQSALKEHTTWFVKPFTCRRRGPITPDSIIKSLGTFDDSLMRCPARYAARISQAFTATESVEIEFGDLEILLVDDICTEDGRYQFTDGCGTMSLELARQVAKKLRQGKQRRTTSHSTPKVLQVRFRGAKGMLFVDYKLHGLTICLPPSMIKFNAVESNHVEVARSFDRPGPYYLNRPLIMLLEGLGVPYETFKTYQDTTVEETRDASKYLGLLAPMLEQYGLGSSYRLPSVMGHLAKLDIDTFANDEFYAKSVDYAVNHILRDLKNRARIPIPGAWTLVGVADVHKHLAPNQIFACIKPVGGKTIYLEGPVLISRSPVIHPGDVMVVEAIGRPEPGSPFSVEPLPNSVVFSTKGDRPVPSCLGGGDLDGDLYNLIPLNDMPKFRPSRPNQPPADYTAAPRKEIDHPSELGDIAEFFVDYINSDLVGVIATNWLLTADISAKGIFDPDCYTLAQLHSDAVDYPKSGQPVLHHNIPKLKSKIKPDWKAPETVNESNRADYYESQSAIGRLCRAIDLPIEELQTQRRPRRQKGKKKAKRDRGVEGITDGLINLDFDAMRDDNLVFDAVENHVRRYIETDRTFSQSDLDDMTQLYNRYRTDLRGHCTANSLSRSRYAQLSEEEALIGTIIQKTAVIRQRTDAMTKLRESTDFLVKAVREQLEGDDDDEYAYLERGWIAWTLSVSQRNSKPGADHFGAASFGWIALGAMFDAVSQIEKQPSYF